MMDNNLREQIFNLFQLVLAKMMKVTKKNNSSKADFQKRIDRATKMLASE